MCFAADPVKWPDYAAFDAVNLLPESGMFSGKRPEIADMSSYPAGDPESEPDSTVGGDDVQMEEPGDAADSGQKSPDKAGQGGGDGEGGSGAGDQRGSGTDGQGGGGDGADGQRGSGAGGGQGGGQGGASGEGDGGGDDDKEVKGPAEEEEPAESEETQSAEEGPQPGGGNLTDAQVRARLEERRRK